MTHGIDDLQRNSAFGIGFLYLETPRGEKVDPKLRRFWDLKEKKTLFYKSFCFSFSRETCEGPPNLDK